MSLIFPDDFDDYAWELEPKGWFSGAKLIIADKIFPLTFYDPIRLAQAIDDDINRSGYFVEPNLIVVRSVTKDDMIRSVDHIIELGAFEHLMPDTKT